MKYASYEKLAYKFDLLIEKIYCIYPANFHLSGTVGKHACDIRYSNDSFDKFKKSILILIALFWFISTRRDYIDNTIN